MNEGIAGTSGGLLARRKPRFGIVKTCLTLCVFCISIALFVFTIPHLNELPDDVRIREIMLDGKRYALIEGTNMDSMSTLCVTRIYSESGGKVVVDQVSAPLAFTKTGIVNRFPIFCPLESFGENDLTFVARSPHGERVLGRFHLNARAR